MDYLEADIKERIRERLTALTAPVKLVFFKENLAGGDACGREEGLLKEVVGLSDKLELAVYDRVIDGEKARAYGIERVPALVLERPGSGRLVFYGKLAGYEFAVLLAALKDYSAGGAEVALPARQLLDSVAQPVRIKVFLSPSCANCPGVARSAQRFAVEYERVRVDLIDVSEFEDVAAEYRVESVPKVVINDRVMFTGAAPEYIFAQAVALSVQGEESVQASVFRGPSCRPAGGFPGSKRDAAP